MGPRARYLGSEVPKEELIWQDPIPVVNHKLIERQGYYLPEGQDTGFRLSIRNWSPTAWASASTFRGSDKRGGATVPAFAWRRRRTGKSTSPPSWRRCSRLWKPSRAGFNNAQTRGKKVSLADLIVLAGAQASSRPRRMPVTR